MKEEEDNGKMAQQDEEQSQSNKEINVSNTQEEKRPHFLDLTLNFEHKLNVNYGEFDHQKGSISPRYLFRKRKNDTELPQKPDHRLDKNIRTAHSMTYTFDTILDFVQDTYFTQDAKDDNEQQSAENKAATNGPSFKFTSLDLLINPLRQKFIWESWAPYEIALFNCCICKFGTEFEIYENIIKTKTKQEIISFYYHWKSSKYYKIWKNNKHKKNKKISQ